VANKRQRFTNPWPHEPLRFGDILRWKTGRGPREAREPGCTDLPQRRSLQPADLATVPAAGWRVVWLGHSSFLLQGAGVSLLVDPVFSNHCGPVVLPGLGRLVAPPCRLEELPPVTAVLLTHSHYDHLDLTSLRRLGRGTPLVVPEGHAGWLQRRGFARAEEVGWWQRTKLAPGVRVVATPAQHCTARTPWDRDRGHWCGWWIEGAGCRLWHAGDTGYCPAFADIGAALGPIDLGLIPIGAYAPRWLMKSMHLDPAEAVLVFHEAKCRQAVAMHWGTFCLTDEAPGDPPQRLRAALATAGIDEHRFRITAVGEIVEILPHLAADRPVRDLEPPSADR
jgi:N-acyl-phosphatidylethanolamine-hydrolysing phospholipase D